MPQLAIPGSKMPGRPRPRKSGDIGPPPLRKSLAQRLVTPELTDFIRDVVGPPGAKHQRAVPRLLRQAGHVRARGRRARLKRLVERPACGLEQRRHDDAPSEPVKALKLQ